MPQQREALSRANRRRFFGHFLEQGLGKSWVALAEAEDLFLSGAIRQLIIVALNGVHLNWPQREIPKHLSVPHRTLTWQPDQTKTFQRECANYLADDTPRLKIFAVNVETFSNASGTGSKFTGRAIAHAPTLMVVDESDTIKSPSAARTRTLWHLGSRAAFKRILTGTPFTESPLDAYAQFKFLDLSLLTHKNFAVFKAYHATWVTRETKDGRKYNEVLHWKNLDHLKHNIDKHSFTLTKAQCMDLPPKLYAVRPVILPQEHKFFYKRVKEEIIVQLETHQITLAFAFTRLIRLQQITGGFVQWDDAGAIQQLSPTVPKIESMLGLINEFLSTTKCIIWARFVHECEAIYKTLPPGSAVRYWGEIADAERTESIDRFQNDPRIRFYVGTQAAGSRGNTLTAASQVIYYSNEFSLNKRLQSEDRCHRIGTVGTITYTDLVAQGTLDAQILEVLDSKKEMSDLFKGSTEAMVAWLRGQQL